MKLIIRLIRKWNDWRFHRWYRRINKRRASAPFPMFDEDFYKPSRLLAVDRAWNALHATDLATRELWGEAMSRTINTYADRGGPRRSANCIHDAVSAGARKAEYRYKWFLIGKNTP